MEIGIERLAALSFMIIGLSHITAPRAWTRFFLNMRDQGEAAGLLNAYVHMPLGLLIVSFHWVWSGPGLLVTLIGCALTLKGILYFLWPERLAAIGLGQVGEENGWKLRTAGVFGVALGLAIGWISVVTGGAT